MSEKQDLTRREASKLAAAAATLSITGAPFISKVKAANNTVQFGFIGVGSRGQYLLQHLKGVDNGTCVAVCGLSYPMFCIIARSRPLLASATLFAITVLAILVLALVVVTPQGIKQSPVSAGPVMARLCSNSPSGSFRFRAGHCELLLGLLPILCVLAGPE